MWQCDNFLAFLVTGEEFQLRDNRQPNHLLRGYFLTMGLIGTIGHTLDVLTERVGESNELAGLRAYALLRAGLLTHRI